MVLDRLSSETNQCGAGDLKLHEKHDSGSPGCHLPYESLGFQLTVGRRIFCSDPPRSVVWRDG